MASSQTSDSVARVCSWVLIGLSIVCILPFIYISRYVHPVNDDFSFALQHVDVPVFQSVIDSYMSWSGRYFATALSDLNPYSWSSTPLALLRTYSVILSVLMLVIPISASVLLAGKYIGRLRAAAAGAFFVLIYLGLCPSTGELLFWFSSYTAYTSGILLSIIFFSILPKKSTAMTVCQCILALLITGSNEVTAVLFTTTLIYLTYTYRSKRLLCVLICAATAIIIVTLSPGNVIRMTHRLSGHPYLWTAAVSIGQTFSWLILWIPALLAATPVYALIGGFRIARLDFFDTSLSMYILFVTMAVIVAHIPPAYGLGSVIIGRTANCLLLFFIIFYFYGINILLHRWQLKSGNIIKAIGGRNRLTVLTCCAMWCFLFIVPFSIDSPFTTAFVDIISGKAQQYDKIQTVRLELARAHNISGEVCCLPSFGITSRTLYIKDIESDPDAEFATDFCKIHGLKCRVYAPDGEVYFENNFDTLKNIGKNNR